MLLAARNKHERDSRIVFYEEGHTYQIDHDDSITYTSVTTFVHHFFSPFDADRVISRMRRSHAWKQSPYFGMSDHDIKESWQQKKDEASGLGTKLHSTIESFYNGVLVSIDTTIEKEWTQFLDFHNRFEHAPYRTEWYVFDEEYNLAGSIDMVYSSEQNNHERVILVDWKRTSELKEDNIYQKGLYPLHDLPDCNFYHYALQLNMYRYILQKHYQKIVDAMYLVVLHPNRETFQQKEVPVMEDYIVKMLQVLTKE